ncbi:MAG TPA: hypothetical protein VK672_00480 [Solirubrobacteraceae bacterium]|nr:hypothetical protein [Solirubrobacteraceae bacterium]
MLITLAWSMQSRGSFVPVRRPLPEEQRAEAIERLLARSTRREGLDWDLYSRVDRGAWGHGASAE